MALQTIQQRVLDQLGDTIGGVMAFTALWVKDVVNLGVRVIVGRVPVEKCKQVFPTKPADFAPDTGMLLETSKIISATREDGDSIPRKCDPILWEDIDEAKDVNSLLAPSIAFPKYTLEPQTDGTVKIKMFPASSSSIATVVYVSYPEIDPSSATTIAGFPEELEPFVDLYVVIQGKIRSLGYYRKLIDDQIDNILATSTASLLATPFTNVTTKTVTHNNGAYPLVQILDSNGKVMAGVVSHSSLNAFTVTFLNQQSGTIITTISTSTGGDFNDFIASLPTWNNISMGTIPTAPTLEADASAQIGSLPSTPSLEADMSSLVSSIPSAPSLEADANDIVALLGAVPTFDGTTTTTLADIDTDRIIHNLNTAADLIWKEQDSTDDLTDDVEGFLGSHDSEMAREAANGANVSTNIASNELETELGKLKNWADEYRSKVANFTAQIDAWLGRWKTYTDEDDLKIKKYLADMEIWTGKWKGYTDEDKIKIEKYLADLQVWLGKWKAFVEEDTLKISKWREQVAQIISQYQADITNEGARFNSELSKARSYLEIAQTRLNITTGYLSSVGLLPNEISQLQKRFDIGINSYIRN